MVALQPIDIEKLEFLRVERMFVTYQDTGSLESVRDDVRAMNFSCLARWAMLTGNTFRRQAFFCEAVRVRNRASDQSIIAGWLRNTWSLESRHNPGLTTQRIRLRLMALMALERTAPRNGEVVAAVLQVRNGCDCGDIFPNERQACQERNHIESHARRVLSAWHLDHPDELRGCAEQLFSNL
jgi:hypothetical protein